MPLWVKTEDSSYSGQAYKSVSKAWVKTEDTSSSNYAWKKIKKIWVKATSGWSLFWPKNGPTPEDTLYLTTSSQSYPSIGTSYPTLTLHNPHWDYVTSITLKYKWQTSNSLQGTWTDLVGYETYQTYTPGNPQTGNYNTKTFTPALTDYIEGKVYFKFVMQATDAIGTTTYEAVSDQITISAPYWYDQPNFVGSSTPGSTFTWEAGIAYFGGDSSNVGYMTTIYKSNDNGITKTYLYGTATQPDYAFSDNYSYSITPSMNDGGYTYYASTYAVVGDSTGPKLNADQSFTVSATKKVVNAPGSFSLTSFVKNAISGSTRTINAVWGTSTDATSYEYQIEASIDTSSWSTIYGYNSGTAIQAPTTSLSLSVSKIYHYFRITVRATNESGAYTYSTNTLNATGTAPNAPVITGTSVSDTTITVLYSQPTNLGSGDAIYYYEYAYKESTSVNYGSWNTTFNTSGQFLISGLTSGKTYNIKMKATNNDGLTGPESNVATARTIVKPDAISYMGARSFTAGSINFEYTVGSNTTGLYYEYICYGYGITNVLDAGSGTVSVSSNSSGSFTISNLTVTDGSLYDITVYPTNTDYTGSAIGNAYDYTYQYYADGSDMPSSSTPTISGISGTGFTASYTLTNTNQAVVDIKSGASSVSGYPKTIVQYAGAQTYTPSETLSGDTSYTFYVTPKYTSSLGYLTYTGTQKSKSLTTNYAPTVGKTLYVSTNGYIGLTSGSYNYNAVPSTGYNLLIYMKDMVQYQAPTDDGSLLLYYWSQKDTTTNATTFVVKWNGYLRTYNNNGNYRITYQAKFYTNQNYCDIKYIHVGANLTAPLFNPGIYLNGSLVGNSIPGPYVLATGDTYRIYYNGDLPTKDIAFDEIAQADMVSAGAVNYGGIDDGYTTIDIQNDKYTKPTISIGTITVGLTSLSIPVSGTYTTYDYKVTTGSYTGTEVVSGSGSTNNPLSITGLTKNTTYYITLTPKNSWGQAGDVAQDTKTTKTLYTVTFNANGGTGSASSTSVSQTTADSSITLASVGTLSKTHYSFGGWNTATDGSGTNYGAGTSYTPTSNITLYAQWNVLYTITFDSQGGTAVSSIEQSSSGGSISKPTDPTKSGVTFGGWATSSTGTTAVTWPRTPSSNETLYAIWNTIATYTVSYDGNGNTGGTAPSDTSTYQNGATVTVKGAGTLTKTGYTLSKWNTKSDGTGTDYTLSSGTFTMGSANVTLYAKWTRNLPGAPTSVAWGTKTYALNTFSTSLSPSASGNATKTQTWTYNVIVTMPISWTGNSNADSYDYYYSTSSSAPADTASPTGNVSGTSTSFAPTQTDRAQATRYCWIRSKNTAGTSSWVAAGVNTAAATVVSGLTIQICRTGTTTCTSGSPSSNNALSYTYTSVNTGYSHVAYATATIAGTLRTVNS